MNITHTAIYTSNVVDNEVVFTTYLTSLMLSLCSPHKAMIPVSQDRFIVIIIQRSQARPTYRIVDQTTQSLVEANDKK